MYFSYSSVADCLFIALRLFVYFLAMGPGGEFPSSTSTL